VPNNTQEDNPEFEKYFVKQARIEPRCRSKDAMQQGLEAQIADPLWALARQWQIAEFKAEDNGSPIRVKVEYESTLIDEAHLLHASSPTDLNNAPPLETLVERERLNLEKNWRIRVQVGQQFERIIRKVFNDTLTVYKKIICTLRHPSKLGIAQPTTLTAIDDATERYISLMQGRVIDGWRLYPDNHIIDVKALYGKLDNSSVDIQLLGEALQKLNKWYKQIYNQPDTATESAWKPNELEHEFTLQKKIPPSSPGGRGKHITLRAPDYRNGDLDWYSTDIESISSNFSFSTQKESSYSNPERIGFAGKPNERWWAFEDHSVNLAALNPDTTDLAKLMLIEFAMVYADDWYQMPLQLKRGSLSKINQLLVYDTFGEEHKILPTIQQVDSETQRWEMFTLAHLTQPEKSNGSIFYVPPTLGDRDDSKPIEEVRFIRDEGANLVFAIEHTVQNNLGHAIDGFEAQLEKLLRLDKSTIDESFVVATPEERKQLLAELEELLSASDKNKTQQDQLPRYRLASPVPHNWIPFKPCKIPLSMVNKFPNATQDSIRLRRATMLRNETDEEAIEIDSMTCILRNPENADQSVIWLNEETVPRAGLKVMLTRQKIRWVDGRTYVWWGRKVKTGRGEGRSGLRFDSIV